MDTPEVYSFLCNYCLDFKSQFATDIAIHERSCLNNNRCKQARKRKAQNKINLVKAKNKRCTLISDHMDSSKASEKRVQIGNEIYFLKNDVSTGPTASLSNYYEAQIFKFEMSFSHDHMFKQWNDFSDTSAVRIDHENFQDLKFYSDQLQTGSASINSGNAAIQRILSYNPSSELPCSWRSTKKRVENFLENLKMLTHEVSFPSEWNIPKEIPRVVFAVRDILDIVACILADPKLQHSGEFYLQTYKLSGKKNVEKGGCDHLMSSPWALKTQRKINSIDPEGILIPIILYEDGITVDSAGVRNVDSIVLTLGNYSRDAFTRDLSKFHVGFVPKISKSSTINSLLKQKFGKSKGLEMFRLFQQQIRRDMYRLILSTVKQVASQGYN